MGLLPGKLTCNVPVQLYESSRVGLQAQATAAASDILRAGQKTLTFGLDNLSNIGDDAVAALIIALRKMREEGGTIVLETRNEQHKRSLRRNGLDHIVSIGTYAQAA
jgi:anti-anti-sigma regulatory factor